MESLLYAKDKQNVPTASDCLLSFIEVVTDSENAKHIPFKLTPILGYLKMIAAVYDALLCLCYVEYSLSQQMTCIATGAFCS